MSLCLIAAMFLASCATESSSVCPQIVTYSRNFQIAAADELDALPKGSALVDMIRDYSQLRDRIRKCMGE